MTSIAQCPLFQQAVNLSNTAAIDLDDADELMQPKVYAARLDAHTAAYDALVAVVDAFVAQAVGDALYENLPAPDESAVP